MTPRPRETQRDYTETRCPFRRCLFCLCLWLIPFCCYVLSVSHPRLSNLNRFLVPALFCLDHLSSILLSRSLALDLVFPSLFLGTSSHPILSSPSPLALLYSYFLSLSFPLFALLALLVCFALPPVHPPCPSCGFPSFSFPSFSPLPLFSSLCSPSSTGLFRSVARCPLDLFCSLTRSPTLLIMLLSLLLCSPCTGAESAIHAHPRPRRCPPPPGAGRTRTPTLRRHDT